MKTKSAFPENLEKRLRARKVIPFVGAGVPMSVLRKSTSEPLFPSWKQLLSGAADRLLKEQKREDAKYVSAALSVEPPKYLDAARHARKALGPLWGDFLRTELDPAFEEVDPESLALARAIWKLGSDLIVTTNFDRVLKWSCPRPEDCVIWNIEHKAEKAYALAESVSRPTVWHLHGHINDVDRMILTPDGYEKLYPPGRSGESHYQAALETLRSELASYTFLFVGFSLDDAGFGSQLTAISDIFGGHVGPHYALLRAGEKERLQGTELPVEPLEFEDFGEPLLEMVRSIAAIAGNGSEPSHRVTVSKEFARFDPAKPYFSVPFRPKKEQVLGRDRELQNLREQLLHGKPTAIGQAAGFQGLGGLGKTQLAVEYASRYRDSYPGGVYWFTVDQDIDSQLIDLAVKSTWVSRDSEHKTKLDVALHRIRSHSSCLIIFDNLEDQAAIEPYLPEYPATPHILATSRIEQSGFVPIPLELLDADVSLQLLLQESGREPVSDPEWDDARAIVEEFGGLPLAIEMAGAYLRRRPVAWGRYLEMLRDRPESALRMRSGVSSFTRHDADVYTTLKISEGLLEEEPLLGDILDVLTWSGSAPMDDGLLAHLLDAEPPAIQPALDLGTTLRLLSKTPEERSYSLFRLVRTVRREDIPIKERLDWFNTMRSRLADWFEAKRKNFKELANFEKGIDHLREWQELAQEYSPSHGCRLLWLQAYPHYHRGRYKEILEIVERALGIYEESQQQNPVLRANLLNDHGFAVTRLGDYRKASELYQEALDIRREVLGPRHPDTARTLGNLGLTYQYLGDHKKALDLQHEALDVQREVLGPRHPDTATTLGNLGGTYGKLGDHKKALDLHRETLDVQREVLGPRHPDTATALGNLGETYSELGDHQKALEIKQEALDILREILGPRHPDTATALGNLGETYSELGDHQKALEIKQEALDIRREVLGSNHPDSVRSVLSIAMTLRRTGKPMPAWKLLTDLDRSLPKDHPSRRPLEKMLSEFTPPGFRKKAASGRKRKRKGKRKH